jgi:hypothetical protein
LKGSRAPDPPAVFDLRLLPGDDPKKKFIVFLLHEEEGKPVPEVKPWHWAQWHTPYDPDTAAAIRHLLLPAEWGETKDGLRMGLRLRRTEVPAGHPVVAEVVIQNVGKADKTIPAGCRAFWFSQQHDYRQTLAHSCTSSDIPRMSNALRMTTSPAGSKASFTF